MRKTLLQKGKGKSFLSACHVAICGEEGIAPLIHNHGIW